MRGQIAVALALCLVAAGCSSTDRGKAAGPPQQRVRPLYAYLVGCDSSVVRLELPGGGNAGAPTVTLLAARTTAWLIPPPEGEWCSVYGTRFEPRNSRLFAVSPEEAGGRTRQWRVLGFRIPDLVFTDAIELEKTSWNPPSILPSADGGRLFVAYRSGAASGEVVAYDIGAPRGARLLEDTIEDTWFTDEAHLGPDGASIYDRQQRIAPDGSSDDFTLDALLGSDRGAPLEPFATARPGGRGAGARTVNAEWADTAGTRILYLVRSKTVAAPAVLDTATGRVAIIDAAPSIAGATSMHLTPEGGSVLVEEEDSTATEVRKNGRIAVFDAATGARTATWTVPQIAGSSAARLLCISPRGELLYAAGGGTLAIFDTRSATGAVRQAGAMLDARTRCFFAER